MIRMGAGPSVKNNEGLVLIQVNKTQPNKRAQESIWAESLGDDLYEIKGPLHMIANLNEHDLVQAVILPGESMPSVSRVVKRSGFRTLHVVFLEAVPILDQQKLLADIAQWNADWEAPFERFYTIKVNRDGNYKAVCEHFEALRIQGLIMYEPGVSLDTLLRFRFLE